MEEAINASNKQYYPITKDIDIPYASYAKLLIKMHGDIEEGNIVLTEDDYLNYEFNFPLTETFVRSLFASKFILFVGFSFNDYNLKIITNKVLNLLGSDFQPMYLLNLETSNELQREYFKGRGVKVIDYNEIIEIEFLNKANKNEREALQQIVSNGGKNLFKFLFVISKFDSFEIENKDLFVIDVLYNAINYYLSELNVIGWEYISKIYPFNYHDQFVGFSLYTKMPALIELHRHLSTSFKNKREFLKTYGFKYRKIIATAINNGIEEITFNLPQLNVETYEFKSKIGQEMSGLDYFYDLDFTNLERYINNRKSFLPESVTIADLELPFLLYKSSRFYDAYLHYKVLAKKCWEKKKYVLFFLCQYNIKALRNSLWDDDDLKKSKWSNLEEIQNEIEKIDVGELLNSIKISNKIISEVLDEVYDHRIVYKQLYDITTLVNKISTADINTRKGGFSSNSDVINLISSGYQVFNFCNKNYVLSEHFYEHKFLYEKVFEGIVRSNNIPDSNSPPFKSSKLPQLLPFHLQLGLFNYDTDKLKALLSEKNILKIELSNEAVIYFEKLTDNLLTNLDTLSNNPLRFRLFVYGLLNNYLLILSKLNVSDNLKIKVINKLGSCPHLDFSSITESLHGMLITLKEAYPENLMKILAILLKDRKKFIHANVRLINYLIDKVTKENLYSFLEKHFSEIFNNEIKFYNNDFTFSITCKLYNFNTNNNKKIINGIVEEVMSNHYTLNFFRIAYEYGIPLAKEYIEKFIESMEKSFPSSAKNLYNEEEAFQKTLFKIYEKEKSSVIRKRIAEISNNAPFLNFLLNIKSNNKSTSISPNWLGYLNKDEFKKVIKNTEIESIVKKSISSDPIKYEWLLQRYLTWT
jgi:hypothetical protein